MTNREYMIALLQDEDFIDNGGISYEAMVYYNIACPYFDGDERAERCDGGLNRAECFRCKEEWLDSEVDE